MDEIDAGIFRWTAPHPEWRTRDPWGHEVASFALVGDEVVSLVDPLLPAEGDARRDEVIAALDRLASDRPALEVLITIPYHARSAEDLFDRYRWRTSVTIWGHRAVAKRFRGDTPMLLIQPGAAAGAAFPYAIGKPRRYETPLYFPAHKALAFGDAVVGTREGLRVWQPRPFSMQWYNEGLLPTLRPLQELDVVRVLPTHGPPVLRDGGRALRTAFDLPAWDCR